MLSPEGDKFNAMILMFIFKALIWMILSDWGGICLDLNQTVV